jgi:hypothetical protein
LEDPATPGRLVVTVFRETGPFFDRSNLTSSIISATLGGVHVKDLQDPVVLYFMRNITITPGTAMNISIVF